MALALHLLLDAWRQSVKLRRQASHRNHVCSVTVFTSTRDRYSHSWSKGLKKGNAINALFHGLAAKAMLTSILHMIIVTAMHVMAIMRRGHMRYNASYSQAIR